MGNLTKRIQRFETLRRLAQENEKPIAAAFAAAEGNLTKAKDTLEQMHSYEAHYQQESYEHGQEGATANTLILYSNFTRNIRESITNQYAAIDELQQKRDHAHSEWMGAHTKIKMFDKLIEKLSKQHVAQLDKIEQKILDEFTTTNYKRNL